ncbi:hypothetical protein ACFL6Y_09280 [Elusimicrobiota bacterium]
MRFFVIIGVCAALASLSINTRANTLMNEYRTASDLKISAIAHQPSKAGARAAEPIPARVNEAPQRKGSGNTFVFKISDLINNHHKTALKVKLGNENYILSGQEEPPLKNILGKNIGNIVLLAFPENASKTPLAINALDILIKSQTRAVGGAAYSFRYLPREITNPFLGDLHINPEKTSLPKYTISVEALIEAIFSKALMLDPYPFRIAIFTDQNSDSWVMLMKDITMETYKSFKRTYIGEKNIPVNSSKILTIKVAQVDFQGMIFYIGQIIEGNEPYLFVRIKQNPSPQKP